MDEPEAVPATPAARERVVETVLAAFVADPAFRFFFPDASTYRAQAAEFAGSLFDRRVTRGGVWVVDGGSAVALWDRPEPDVDPVSGPAGSAPTSLDLPADVLGRLAAYDAAVHPTLPHTPHWYLGVLATHPEAAGRRWGRAVMAAGLAEAGREGMPAYLETTNDDNVELYRRVGWQVVHVEQVGPLLVRVMRHPAGA